MTGRKWVRRSLRHLSGDLHQQGHRACPNTVGRLLRKQKFSLQSNRKGQSGQAHPDRDRQFRHIQQQREQFTAAGLPVVSVDAKKKELVGNFKNAGVTWCRKAESVNIYDFIHDAQCRATPYALYDPTRNRGMVAVGTSADTAQFATDSIAHWWQQEGRQVTCGLNNVGSGRWRRQQRPSLAAVQIVPATVRQPEPRGGDGLPLPDRGLQVEPGGAPAAQPDQHQLGG
jgi:hypothetical protein